MTSVFAFWVAIAAAVPVTVPFEFYGNAIWLPVTVNGRGPYHVMFDTAAGRSVLNASKVKDAGLKVLQEFDQANAGSGDKPARIQVLGDAVMEFGGVKLAITPLLALPLDEVASTYGTPIDGIIGWELMEKYVVGIDFDKRTLTLTEPGAFRYEGPGAVLPIEVGKREFKVRARVELPGRGEVEGVFEFDEPHPGAVLFAQPFVERHDLLNAARKLGAVAAGGAMGVGGKVDLVKGRVRALNVGPFRMEMVPAGFPQAKGGAFARTDIAGIIGGEVWRRFRVWIDCAHSRLILEQGAQYGDPFAADAAGIRLKLEGERLVVAAVNEGSPAEAAGIAVGDELVQVNGQAARWLKLWGIRLLFAQTGQIFELVLRRGGKEMKAKMATRALY